MTDNASNIRNCVELTGDEGLECFAQTLNLCVHAGLKVTEILKVVGAAMYKWCTVYT